MIIIANTLISKPHPLIVLFLKEYSIIVNEFLKISNKGTFQEYGKGLSTFPLQKC